MAPKTMQYLSQVVDSNFLNDGPLTKQFEEKIAHLCKTRFALAVTSGTAALFLSLKACDIGPGDEVLVPDLTFIATANAVRMTGATPVLVDTNADTFNISAKAAKAAIGKKTKAIVPVHVTGRFSSTPELLSLAKEHNLRIVEDAAEALGSCIDGQPLGSWGDLGCFSFSPNKTITTGQGGMIVTNNESLYRRLVELKDQGRPVRGTGGADEHVSLGFNFKFTDLQAAVGLAQFECLSDRLDHLRHVYSFYREHLSTLSQISFPTSQMDRGECPQWTDIRLERRDSLYNFLTERGIHPRKYWFPLHTQAPYRQSGDHFPVSIQVSQEALWLPSAFTLTEEHLSKVCQSIREWAQ